MMTLLRKRQGSDGGSNGSRSTRRHTNSPNGQLTGRKINSSTSRDLVVRSAEDRLRTVFQLHPSTARVWRTRRENSGKSASIRAVSACTAEGRSPIEHASPKAERQTNATYTLAKYQLRVRVSSLRADRWPLDLRTASSQSPSEMSRTVARNNSIGVSHVTRVPDVATGQFVLRRWRYCRKIAGQSSV